MGYARIQNEPFSLDEVLRELRSDRSGGVTFYIGTVRKDDGGRRVESLTYESFDAMAKTVLERLRSETVQKFGLVDAIVIHRVGEVAAGEAVLLVALSGVHRAETFEAVRHFMDRLKEVVPIWKKEEGEAGTTWILGPEGRRVKS